ncbi:nitrate reductase [Hoeflea sp. BAL378]|uniref:nitrate reductase n=1 Tax=Hoeflea sp. BAL378 TaxID=1547437 RepID=UPI0005143072|nr:nitrate reductase [Hoeflea sp. BAL378]KGF70818.1 nitrate reductase [Hoeflea sp. BAL378]
MSDSPAPTVKTTCPYCGVGCGVLATLEEGGAVTIKGDPDHPANLGRLCSKGSALGETIDLDGRLLTPEIAGDRATWDEALDLVASKFAQAIAEHGPDSVAFYVSGQLLTEDYYVANKLMKGFIGSANIDTNSRLCMASSVAGHRRAFGSDTVPGTYEDLELADLVVLTGSNLAWCHPVLYQRIAAAKAARPEMRVVLIDPRRTMTADIADLHLAIAPDGDVGLFLGLLAHLADNGFVDAAYVGAFTTGLEDALAIARAQDLAGLVSQTGLPVAELEAFLALWAASEKVVTVYSQGVNQSLSGTDKVNAIINCHLATGRIGRPGMGPFSVTGQPNAMGGREVGGLATTLAAHMDIENPAHRDRVQRFWKSPVIATKPGLKAVDLFEAVGDGRIKALWIMATNPVDSMPDASAVEAALKACPFVVVSDLMAETDTIRHAHVRLPSLGWGEKDGTVTNSERRISRQRAFLPAPGEAKADWWQMAQVGKRMGHGKAFDFANAASILREYAAQTAFENDGARDLDIGACAGMDDDAYEALAPFQWPRPADQPDPATGTRFFAKGGFFTKDRLARFVAVEPARQGSASADFRFTLNTGRVRDHWHTMTRTGKSARLSVHVTEPFVEIHPRDAQALGIEAEDLMRVTSVRGEIIVRSLITDRQRQGSLFVPMHWTDQWASGARVDRLVAPEVDPVSGQPALKVTSAGATRFEASLHGFVVSRVKPVMHHADYWAVARAQGGWRAEFAMAQAPTAIQEFIYALLGLDPATPLLSFTDPRGGLTRHAAFDGVHLAGAVYLSERPVAVSRSWAVDQLDQEFANLSSRWRVIAGRPANDMPDKGAIVCACMNVGINDIVGAIRGGCASLDAIAGTTAAGTNCGSCKAEIKVILDEHQILAAE